MASVASQLIEEVTAHLEDAREICADGTYFPNKVCTQSVAFGSHCCGPHCTLFTAFVDTNLYLKLITRGHNGHSSKQFSDWLLPQYIGFSLKYLCTDVVTIVTVINLEYRDKTGT